MRPESPKITHDDMQINPTAPTKGQFSKYHHDLTNAVHHQQNNTWLGNTWVGSSAGNLAYRAGLSCMAGACLVGETLSPVEGKTLAEGTGKLLGGVFGFLGGIAGGLGWAGNKMGLSNNDMNPQNTASSVYHKVHDNIVDSVDYGPRSQKYLDARALRNSSAEEIQAAHEVLEKRGLNDIPQDKLDRLIAIDDDRGAKDSGSPLRQQLNKMRLIAGDRGNGNDVSPPLGIIELNGTASNPENSVQYNALMTKKEGENKPLLEKANDAVKNLQENTDKLHALHRKVQDFTLNESTDRETIIEYCTEVKVDLKNKITAKETEIDKGIQNDLGEGQEELKEEFIVALKEDIQKLEEEKNKITEIHTNLTKNKPLSRDDKSALIDAYTVMQEAKSNRLCNEQKRFLAELTEQTQKLEKYRGILELNNPLLEDLTRSSDTIMNAAAERVNGNSIESGTGCTATSKDGSTEILKVKIPDSPGSKEQKEVALELTNQEFEKLAEQWNNDPANKDRQVTVSRRWFSDKLYIQFPKDDKGTQLMNDYKSHMTGEAGQKIMADKYNVRTDLDSDEKLGETEGEEKSVSMTVEEMNGYSSSQQPGNNGQPPSMTAMTGDTSSTSEGDIEMKDMTRAEEDVEMTNMTKVERDDVTEVERDDVTEVEEDSLDETGISISM